MILSLYPTDEKSKIAAKYTSSVFSTEHAWLGDLQPLQLVLNQCVNLKFAKILQNFYTEEKLFLLILQKFCTFFPKFLHIFCKIFAHFLQNFCTFFTKILQNFLKHFLQKKKGNRGQQCLILQPLLEKNINKRNRCLMSKFQIDLLKFCKKFEKKIEKKIEKKN